MKKKPLQSPAVEFPMRVNRYLALKGHATRRGADDLVSEGRVLVNGRLASLGDKVLEDDQIEVRYRGGKPQAYEYVAYNKPRNIVTHSAGKGEKDIGDVLNLPGLFPVGRLDKDSTGLIIMTNDGRITDRLLGPMYEHEKEYVVHTKNPLRSSFKQKMEAGVQIERERTLPCKVTIENENMFRVTLTEGKKHQIRRMCSALFQEIDTLKRVRIMNIELGKLAEGSWRKIQGEELETFLELLGLQ